LGKLALRLVPAGSLQEIVLVSSWDGIFLAVADCFEAGCRKRWLSCRIQQGKLRKVSN